MLRLSLNFENMPERHAELAWRFGEPDECVEEEAGQGDPEGRGCLWVLKSPLSYGASAQEHLGWAAECLGPHEAFVGELISLGGRVVLRLEGESVAPDVLWKFDARRLLPMAHAGVLIEFRVRMATEGV